MTTLHRPQPILITTYTQLRTQLATWRHNNHIPQTEIAPKLGIHHTTLSNWENGYRIPAGDHLIDLIHALQADLWITRREPGHPQ